MASANQQNMIEVRFVDELIVGFEQKDDEELRQGLAPILWRAQRPGSVMRHLIPYGAPPLQLDRYEHEGRALADVRTIVELIAATKTGSPSNAATTRIVSPGRLVDGRLGLHHSTAPYTTGTANRTKPRRLTRGAPLSVDCLITGGPLSNAFLMNCKTDSDRYCC